MSGQHVFEDGRLGLWIARVDGEWRDRLPKIRAFVNGAITDLFLPRDATKEDISKARGEGFYAHLWAALDGLDAHAYAARTMDDVKRVLGSSGAVDLNIEMAVDEPLARVIREAVTKIRVKLPARRLRINIAPRKGFALPADLLASDPNLYACEQAYFGNMDARFSEADALLDLLEHGVPLHKASICYAAACSVGGITGAQRVNCLPIPWTPRRGVIFQDDLMAEAGLL